MIASPITKTCHEPEVPENLHRPYGERYEGRFSQTEYAQGEFASRSIPASNGAKVQVFQGVGEIPFLFVFESAADRAKQKSQQKNQARLAKPNGKQKLPTLVKSYQPETGTYTVTEGNSTISGTRSITNGAIAPNQPVIRKGKLIDQMRKTSKQTTTQIVKASGNLKYLYSTENESGQAILAVAGWKSKVSVEIMNLQGVILLNSRIDNLGASGFLVSLIYSTGGKNYAEVFDSSGNSVWKLQIPTGYPIPTPVGSGLFVSNVFGIPGETTFNSGQTIENFDVAQFCSGYTRTSWSRQFATPRTYKIFDGAIEVQQGSKQTDTNGSSITNRCPQPNESSVRDVTTTNESVTDFVSPTQSRNSFSESTRLYTEFSKGSSFGNSETLTSNATRFFLYRYDATIERSLGVIMESSSRTETVNSNGTISRSNTGQLNYFYSIDDSQIPFESVNPPILQFAQTDLQPNSLTQFSLTGLGLETFQETYFDIQERPYTVNVNELTRQAITLTLSNYDENLQPTEDTTVRVYPPAPLFPQSDRRPPIFSILSASYHP